MSQGQHTGVVPSLELSEGLLSSTEMEHTALDQTAHTLSSPRLF